MARTPPEPTGIFGKGNGATPARPKWPDGERWQYVRVESVTNECGTTTPTCIVWSDGRRFNIDGVSHQGPANDGDATVYVCLFGRGLKTKTRRLYRRSIGAWYVVVEEGGVPAGSPPPMSPTTWWLEGKG